MTIFGSLTDGEAYERFLRLEAKIRDQADTIERQAAIIQQHERFQARLNELIARFAVGVAARKS